MKVESFRKVSKVLLPSLVVLTNFTFVALLIEVYKYKGFLFKHFFISTDLLIGLVFVIGIIVITLSKKKGDQHTSFIAKYSVKYIRFFLLPLVVLYLVLNAQNDLNYSNYVFSKYHLQPKLLLRPITLGIFLVAIFYVRDKLITDFTEDKLGGTLYYLKNKGHKKTYFQLALFAGLMALIIVFTTSNLLIDVSEIYANLITILKNSKMSEQEKYGYIMRKKYDYFFDYIMFVKSITPEEATILLPPQKKPWQLEGNQRLVRYFLYPRTLYSAHEDNLPNNFDFVLLAWGSEGFLSDKENDYGWPKIPFDSEKVYLYNTNSNTYEVYYGKYEPESFLKKDAYGLIKIQ